MVQACAHDHYPEKPISPYGVVATSVIPSPETEGTYPLLPFEQRQLKTLLQQVDGAPSRVQGAFLAAMEERLRR